MSKIDKECNNYGSSWCADFDCADCPVRDLRDSETIITGMDSAPDESLLLSDEEFVEFYMEHYLQHIKPEARRSVASANLGGWVQAAAREAQLAKDMKHEQARVDEIVRHLGTIEESLDYSDRGMFEFRKMVNGYRQALKKREGVE